MVGFILRIWGIGSKGLAYDEAATALMARATLLEIIEFHWVAAFEHPPLWQLVMHLWSNIFGQSESALRFLPAVAGTLVVFLTWLWVRKLWPDNKLIGLFSAGFVATSPVLVLYSQEARMYSLVLLLAILSLMLTSEIVISIRVMVIIVFVVVNWFMIGFHYYSLLLVVIEGIFLSGIGLLFLRSGRFVIWSICSIFVSLVPIVLWMSFSPGFRDTLSVVTGGAGVPGTTDTVLYIRNIWQDLSFGAIRWQPDAAKWGVSLIPFVLLGLVTSLSKSYRRDAIPWGWLLAMCLFAPLLSSLILSDSLASRYILYVVPIIYIFIAYGIVWLGDRFLVVGLLGVLVVLVVSVLGLSYYHGPYLKSQYREMAAHLQSYRGSTEGVMLYAPRQHLLAKYYLPDDWDYYTAPHVELPEHWPFTAPPIVPEDMDDRIQNYLRVHPALWLVVTAENEVDPGEFIPKYLTAVSYDAGCDDWLDVQLCKYISPHANKPEFNISLNQPINDELVLRDAKLSIYGDQDDARHYILTNLNWFAIHKPSVNYRVTLRLLDENENILSQRDRFPIGNLLPPTTWEQGKETNGYMALPIPDVLPSGMYRVVVGIYDPSSGELFGDILTLLDIPLSL